MKQFILGVLILFAPITVAQDRVSLYDFDQDGKVSFDDLNRYCDVSLSLFKRADKNDNNYLNNLEMREARRYLFTRCNPVNKVSTKTSQTLLEE
jgi:Ca2+-binding EF-hand superfamily protein